MKVIYKYEVHYVSETKITLPENAKILSCKAQGNIINIWALVDTYPSGYEDVYFKIVGTGEKVKPNILDEYEFLDTVLVHNDSLVFHIFKRK